MNHPVFPVDEVTLSVLDAARVNLFSALVGDAMDNLGLPTPFLSPRIRPVDDQMVVVGWAMPVTEVDVDGANSESTPFGVMFEALDDLKPGEVYVASGGSPSYALWGGLMSTRAMQLGAAGAVLELTRHDGDPLSVVSHLFIWRLRAGPGGSRHGRRLPNDGYRRRCDRGPRRHDLRRPRRSLRHPARRRRRRSERRVREAGCGRSCTTTHRGRWREQRCVRKVWRYVTSVGSTFGDLRKPI